VKHKEGDILNIKLKVKEVSEHNGCQGCFFNTLGCVSPFMCNDGSVIFIRINEEEV